MWGWLVAYRDWEEGGQAPVVWKDADALQSRRGTGRAERCGSPKVDQGPDVPDGLNGKICPEFFAHIKEGRTAMS